MQDSTSIRSKSKALKVLLNVVIFIAILIRMFLKKRLKNVAIAFVYWYNISSNEYYSIIAEHFNSKIKNAAIVQISSKFELQTLMFLFPI